MQSTAKTTQADSAGQKPQDVEDEEDLYKKAIVRAYAKKSALLEPEAVKPPDVILDSDTLKEGPQIQDGEITNGLSDLIDADDYSLPHTKTFSKKLILIFSNDRRVWLLTALNLLVALISLAILITTVVFAIEIFNVDKAITKIAKSEQPCLYQWSEWGPCSETCSSSSRLPSRSRHVLNKTILQARGHFPSCPKNLETMAEHMPCNVYRCPVALSSFTNWTQCFYNDPNIGEAGGCYKMRDLPTTNQLIYIDTTEITKHCDCPTHIA